MNDTVSHVPDFRERLLAEALHGVFGDVGAETLAALMEMLEWVEVPGGEVVVRQGGTDRDLYFVVCGRLRAYGGDGPWRRRPRPTPSLGPERRALSEIVRGETIGEVSFFTGAPRNATVVALRDSVLVRISRPNLEKLVTAHPQVTLSMARLVIARLRDPSGARRAKRRPANLCLLPISPGIDALDFGRRLLARFPEEGEAILLTASELDARLGEPGIANAGRTQGEAYRRITKALDEMESRHAAVVYVPDADLGSEWSRRCVRMADRVLLLASASASPEADPVEARYLSGEERLSGAEQVLVLLHDDERRIPEGTAGWLERRPAGAVAGHVHVRSNSERDLTRLMRLQSARATGLVLCGGGARCFAHLGVYRALQEQGIRIDRVGGSGLGAVMGALIALDAPAEELIAYVREAFQVNPTGDISWLPLTALVRGKRLKAMLDEAIEHVGAAGARIEDTWIDFFCVASNYSKAYEVVLRRGDLSRSLRASCAVPGLLPPVPIAGDLMVDGGAFNSYPTDVMARSGVARIIGVNIARDANPEFSLDEIPGSLALAWDKVTGSRRKYRVPSLMSIMMNAMTLNSAAREQGADSMADLEFRINLPSVGVFDWHAFEHAVDVGYRHAGKVLREMPAHELAAFRN